MLGLKLNKIVVADVLTTVSFTPAALMKNRLLTYLKDNSLEIFPYDEMTSYLNGQFEISGSGRYQNQTWGWRPLRAYDIGKSDLVDWSHRRKTANGKYVFETPYQAPIPGHILEIVRDISKTVSCVYFFVSDVPKMKKIRERVRPDPFLAATCSGLKEMIIVAAFRTT